MFCLRFFLIIPFFVVFSLILATTGVGIGRKGPAAQPKRQNEELEADKAMKRTMAKLSTDGEHGRFVLLVCKGKCLRERADIPSWIREFNKIHRQNRKANDKIASAEQQIANHRNSTKNGTNSGEANSDDPDPPLGYYFHFYKKPFPRADIERALKGGKGGGKKQQQKSLQQSVAAFYVVGGQLFPMGERVGRKDKFLKWLATFEHPQILMLEDGEIDGWLNSEKCHQDAGNGNGNKRRRDEQSVLLVVHDPEVCPETLLPNLARSFVQIPHFAVLELRRPLTEDDDFVLHWRLQNAISDNCRMDILLRGEFFVELPATILGSELHQIVHNITELVPSTAASSNCTHLDVDDSLGLQKILGPLNPIETEFLREERHLKAIEHNRQYLIVGAIGGVAVLAMAMSIFWGLNGNDFVPKQ